MYNLLEYSQNYSITSGSFCNYYRDEIDDVNDNASDGKSFKYETKILGKTPEIPPQPPPNSDGSQPSRPKRPPYYNVIINGKKFYDQPIDSYVKQYEEIRKLATGQSEDYTTGCFLGYEYKKTHYRLTADDLSRQKKLDADPKVIQQTEFVGQLKNSDDRDADEAESIFVSTILDKMQRNKIKLFSGKRNSIIKDDKLSRSEGYTNDCTINQIKISNKK